MSAIAGIWNWDGRPISEQDLSILASHSRTAGPDGGGNISPIPGLALQAHVLHFDRLATMERQPHVFAGGSVLTLDGRLDNREDLLVRLHHDLGPDISDAALVAAAYVRWGPDCLPRLIGDWSLAIWDATNRRIVLARDYMGNRPLYYLERPGGLAWASSLHALADCFDLHGEPDEAYIAGWLAHDRSPHLTPFRNVRALRSGHMLSATPNTAPQVSRYWTFQPARIRFRELQDYADRARELLTEAVRVRLRVRGRAWSHLSGGFDSSSIVCLANTLITRGCVEASALQPISTVYSASPESDETRFISCVERWCRLTTVKREIESREVTFAELLARHHPFAYGISDALESPMVAAGDRVVFSGEGGDLVMVRGSSQQISLLEALHEGHPWQFLQLCLARVRARNRHLPTLLAHLVSKGYLSRNETRSRQRRKLPPDRHVMGASLEPPVVARVTPSALARASEHSATYPALSEFPVAKLALLQSLYRIMDHPATSSSDFVPEIWMTFPFTHRPLVEFIIGVPQLAFWNPVVSRAGMKRALADVLPAELLARNSKGEPQTGTARRQLATAAEYARVGLPPELPSDWQLVARGYLRLEPLVRAVDAVRAGIPPSKFLRESVNIEAWLRATARAPTNRRVATKPDAVGTSLSASAR